MSLLETQPERRSFLRRHRTFIAVLLAASAIALFSLDPFQWLPARTESYRVRIVRVAYPLEYPWGLAFLPNGDMLVTERPGRLRIVRNGVLQEAWIPGVPR